MKYIKRLPTGESKTAWAVLVTYLDDNGKTSMASFDAKNDEDLHYLVVSFAVKRAVYSIQVFPTEAPVAGVNQRNLTKRIRSFFRGGRVEEEEF